MRRYRFVLALTGLLAFVALAAQTVDAGGQQARPALKVARPTPLLLRGLSFKPNERVLVKGKVNWTQVSTAARANRAGTFELGFGGKFDLGGCSGGASLKATGSLGSVATLNIPPRLCS